MSRKPATFRTRAGHYPAAGWRQSNPQYRRTRPRAVVVNGVECVEVDGGLVWDAVQQGKAGEARR